ncbi:phage head closure protein [Macrococcus animalis]|uniref:phage head closure protein n=1 Tax=Macrococcus animalis TaxID=3395467 RepID=UPI0039BE2E94
MFNMFYTHNITITRSTTTLDKTVYPPKETTVSTTHDLTGFMDTPSTSEQLKYKNMQKDLSRQLYLPYDSDIKSTDTVTFESVRYRIIGDIEDQGGQHEVIKIPLTRE